MFTYIQQLISKFHSKPITTILTYSLALLILTILLVSFIRWLKRRHQESNDNWMGLVTGSVGNVLKVLSGIAILIGLCLYLRFQSDEFSRKHGGTSQRNYNAVKMIWGKPHIQNELSVSLATYSKKYYDKNGLEFDAEKLHATTQLVAYREKKIEHILAGNWIIEADHNIDLAMNYRKKGTGTYPGFEVDWKFVCFIENSSGKDAAAKFHFPLPSGQGLVDKLNVEMDGEPLGGKVTVSGGYAWWKMPIDAGQKMKLSVSYHSRGLDYIRLNPGSGKELRKYRVKMNLKGLAEADINYPIGCMTPTEKKSTSDGMIMDWNLDRAVTRLGMGVILPKKRQAGYYTASVLDSAWWALVLMLAMIVITHLVAGKGIQYKLVLLSAAGFELYYLLMANIGNYSTGLSLGMTISGIILTLLLALLWFKLSGKFTAITAVLFFAIFCVGWPLITISDYRDLLTVILYVVMLAYTITLLAVLKKSPCTERKEQKQEGENSISHHTQS